MSDLLVCIAFLWYVAILVGIVMIEYRLSRITRFLDREEKKRGSK
jgi:cell division protein FtsW (lipid II flippase)